MAPMMLLLPTKVPSTTEEKMNTCTDQHCPMYHQRPQTIQENLDSCIKTYHNTNSKEG